MASDDATPFDRTLTWVGTGFAAVAGIVAFFGIKDGSLTSVVRTEPNATLAVFLLVGAAVVLALIVPILPNIAKVPPWLLVGLAGLVLTLTSIFAPDLPPNDPRYAGVFPLGVAIGSLLVALVVAAVFRKRKEPPPPPAKLKLLDQVRLGRVPLPLRLVCLILAILCLGGGLWTVTKISVINTMKLDIGAVTASMEVKDGQPIVTLSASGTELAGPVLVRLWGDKGEAKTMFSEMSLMPSKAGALSATTSVPVTRGPYDVVRIETCQEFNRTPPPSATPSAILSPTPTASPIPTPSASLSPTPGASPTDADGDGSQTQEQCNRWAVRTTFTMEQAPAADNPLIGLVGTLKSNANGKRVDFRVDGAGVAAGDYVKVDVTRETTPVAEAQVEAGSAGTVSWTGNASVGTGSAKWTLMATVCTPDLSKASASTANCHTKVRLATLTTTSN